MISWLRRGFFPQVQAEGSGDLSLCLLPVLFQLL